MVSMYCSVQASIVQGSCVLYIELSLLVSIDINVLQSAFLGSPAKEGCVPYNCKYMSHLQ